MLFRSRCEPRAWRTNRELVEDVARFRALSPAERVREIRGMLAIGAHLMKISPKAAWAREYAEEQELLAQQNIREFIARHGG